MDDTPKMNDTVEETARIARAEVARIEAELQAIHETYREGIKAECARHEARLRDMDDRFHREKALLERHREAVMSRLVTVVSMAQPRPHIIFDGGDHG